jgi:hypothetical protein
MPATYTRFVKFHHMHNLHCVHNCLAREYFLYYRGVEIASIKETVAWVQWDDRKEEEVIDALQVIKLFG